VLDGGEHTCAVKFDIERRYPKCIGAPPAVKSGVPPWPSLKPPATMQGWKLWERKVTQFSSLDNGKLKEPYTVPPCSITIDLL